MGGGYRTPPISQSITSAAHDDDRRLELRLNGRSSLCHARSRTATLFALSFLVLEGRGLSRFLIKPPPVAL